jgi:hypothetical protein
MIAQEVLSVEPIYERTDYCSDPKTLWGKLKSAKWDWLGIDARDDFVLGYPKRKGAITDTLVLEVRRHGMFKDNIRFGFTMSLRKQIPPETMC